MELGIVLWGDFDRHVDLQLEAVIPIAAAGFSTAVASFLIPNHFYRLGLSRLALPTVEAPLQKPAADYRSAVGSERVFRDPDAARTSLFRIYQTPFILGIALSESVALFGLVVAQGRLAPSVYGLPFFAVSWLLLAFRFPTEARITRPAERFYGARL